MTNFVELLRLLSRAKIDFVIVGGVAATVHGSARSTQDLDIVYRRTPENISALAAALQPLQPALRGALYGGDQLAGRSSQMIAHALARL